MNSFCITCDKYFNSLGVAKYCPPCKEKRLPKALPKKKESLCLTLKDRQKINAYGRSIGVIQDFREVNEKLGNLSRLKKDYKSKFADSIQIEGGFFCDVCGKSRADHFFKKDSSGKRDGTCSFCRYQKKKYGEAFAFDNDA